MPSGFIDLRSDTATLPTPAMRRAMAEAELGDDMFGEDPTVNRLEERVAGLLGMEAAMFVPSGSMSNQLALRLHLRPGDEILCETHSHIVLYEGGGPAALSGAMCQTIPGRQGMLDLDDFRGRIRPDNIHCPRTRLVSLENTHNRANGAVLPLANVARICGWAKEHGLARHLDGARLWNAVAKTGVPLPDWAAHFDTVSLCFSKGMGCPVGSILVGPRALLKDGRRVRKLFGGAMRQAGILAAAALHALDHHRERLAEDHAHAQQLAAALEATGKFDLKAADIQTNILWIPCRPAAGDPLALAAKFKERGILVGAYGENMIRMCTHLGVSAADTAKVVEAIRTLAG
jgi:threonine aldolase